MRTSNDKYGNPYTCVDEELRRRLETKRIIAILYQCRATGFRKDQEYSLCSGYRKGKHVCPTPHILHEFVEKIVVHNATDPHSRVNRRQEINIYYKGIGVLEMTNLYATRQK